MQKKPQHQQYADTIANQLDMIEKKFRMVKEMVEFARSWDDENGMFWFFFIQNACNVDHMINAARGNLERLTALANPAEEPDDLPF